MMGLGSEKKVPEKKIETDLKRKLLITKFDKSNLNPEKFDKKIAFDAITYLSVLRKGFSKIRNPRATI